ncbi:MAG: hypothetical protein Q9225_007104 [Loekoesia sp. 1 TL-2023]
MADSSEQEGHESCNRFSAQKRTIEKIAAEYGSTETRVARGYHSMLDKLGVEIYSQAVHFALELIQNADDASYTRLQPSQVPYLAFEAKKNLIHVRCNEDGFSTEDVEALCDVDQSTKSATNAIGKKGIGFKSVFKVCDKVQIGSNGFQLEFDKSNGPFGMVKPKWREFPEWLKNQKETLMRLTLSPDEILTDIYEDFENLEPSVLLFLRNIEKICMYTPDFQRIITCKDRKGSVTTITTETAWFRDEESDIEEVEYVIVKHPPEGSIPEVVLAFPRSVDGEFKTQQVYNFLPISDYGFKFIIQADFHLTSSREAIDESSKWNQALRDAIPAAFLSAVHYFNGSEDNSLTWIQFLPAPSTLRGLFSSMDEDVDDHLKEEKVLFSQKGSLMKPSCLIYVSQKFRLRGRWPVPLQFQGRYTLSTRYDRSDITALKRLGVKQLNEAMFVAALKRLGLDEWSGIHWHEDLAEILLKINTEHLLDVPLISVGRLQITWLTAREIKGKPVYFKEDLGDDQIPEGIKLRFVSIEASRSEHRHELFAKLGVKPFDEIAVCEAIQRVLGDPSSQPSIEIAVSQTKYLFQRRDKFDESNIRFWSVVENRSGAIFSGHSRMVWAKGSDLYFDDPRESPYPITRLLGSMSGIQFLHPDYLQEESAINMREWMNWLIERQLAVIPRATSKGLVYGNWTSSAEFRYFVQNATTRCLCKVFQKHWAYYKLHLHVISELVQQRLGQRIFPTRHLGSVALSLGMPSSCGEFLDVRVSVENEENYHMLQCFGLITEANARFYLKILRYHRESSSALALGLIHKTYSLLQHCSDVSQTRNAFKKEKLIAVEIKHVAHPRIRWFKSDECFWSELSCLRFNSGLSGYYTDCEKFFRNTLGISDVATIQQIVVDLENLAGTNDLKFIRENVKPITFRLSTLMRRAKEDRFESHIITLRENATLKELKIYPVVGAGGKTSKVVSGQKFTSDSLLFVPDRPDLYELFRDKVQLLDFSPNDVHEIWPLIESFPSARLLSTEVRKSLSYRGERNLQQAMTEDYRQKHDCILRCIRHYLPSHDAEVDGSLHQKLKRIKVYEVENIDYVQWLEEKAPRSGNANGSSDLSVSTQEAIATVKTSGDVILRQDQERFTIHMTKNKSLRRKAVCHSIPERLVAELGLPGEAKGLIAPVLELDPSLSSDVLDEKGIARLPGTVFAPLNPNRTAPPSNSSRLYDSEDLATPSFGSTSREQITSASWESSRLEISRTCSNAAERSGAPRQLVIRQLHPVGTGSRPARTPSSQRSQLFRDVSKGPSPTPLSPPSRLSSPQRLATSSDLSSTDEDVDIRTGPTKLLNSILLCARQSSRDSVDLICTQTTTIPSTPPTLSDDPPSRYPHSTIGFLGELFVVEFLSQFLPRFTPDQNWTSRLRKRAEACPGYENIGSYEEAEVSDITYVDEEGEFVRWLQRLGYNLPPAWPERSMTFHIEVKTTVRGALAPFIMSAGQIEHAKRWTQQSSLASASPEGDSQSCYLIMRVYGILNLDRDMRIYMDPYALIQQGLLEQKARQYSITAQKLSPDDEDGEGAELTGSETESEGDTGNDLEAEAWLSSQGDEHA